jgi:uncharacterized protein DUF4389
VTAKRVLLIVFGSIIGLVGLVVLAAGGAILWADQTLRDDDGYFTSRTERFETDARAIVTENVDLTDVPGGPDRWADLRIRARGAGDRAIFVGIARREDVQRYLAGVPYTVLTDVDSESFRPRYRQVAGSRAPAPPGEQRVWAARAQGRGAQTLTWDVSSGNWQIVAMNPDGSPGVVIDASGGVKIAYLLAIAIAFLAGGILLLGGGVTMLIFGVRRPRGPPSSGAVMLPEGAGVVAAEAGAPSGGELAALPPGYPVDVTGQLDPELSRWMWLVKWLLAIPHLVVLFFLGIAYFVVTVIAFFAILFTGRYPRDLFEFNAGVLRWTWRVDFYAYGVLGTDRYPPFSLERADDDPAMIEVPYPERLSRGLVLVKWWLLAIPHYVVALVFRWLIAILVFFAAVALLFTGRYPRGIFDLVLGMNRWVFRVAAYATLMRDEYPPFRLER